MPEVFLLVAALLLIAGTFVLWLVWWHWDSVGAIYQDAWPKFAIGAARFLCAVAAIGARVYAEAGDAQVWNFTIMIAAVSWLSWEALQIIADKNSKTSLADTRSLLWTEHAKSNHLRRELFLRTAILVGLRKLVNEKNQRLGRLPHGRTQNAGVLAKLGNSLAPERHMYSTLASVALAMRSFHIEPQSSIAMEANFRVGLYVPIGLSRNDTPDDVQDSAAVLAPWMGFDLKTGRDDPFSSYRKHWERFALDNHEDPAHAVRCLQEQRTIIISDTAAEGVRFFHASQENYLKSLVAHPICGIRDENGNPVNAALMIDCDRAGIFRESDRDSIEFLLDEFASRLVLESNLLAWKRVIDGGKRK